MRILKTTILVGDQEEMERSENLQTIPDFEIVDVFVDLDKVLYCFPNKAETNEGIMDGTTVGFFGGGELVINMKEDEFVKAWETIEDDSNTESEE